MLDKICISIQNDLRRVEEVTQIHLKSDLAIINTITSYVTQNGGKRLRPALFLLAAKLSGATGDHLPRLAASFEMLHTASLLHDDVVDDASLRRGKPSTKVKWGNQVSVLVGDYLWSKASEIWVTYGNQHLLSIVMKAINALTEGVVLELSRHNDLTMDRETYLRMIRGKTAALFSACTEGAGVVAGVSEPFVEALKRYGMDLGVAFQLADDMLDYASDEVRFGKKAGGDLREGKLTYPFIVSFQKADESERRLLQEVLISDHLTSEQFESVLAVMKKYQALEATQKLAQEFADKAKSHLVVFKSSLEREALSTLADYAVDRED